MTVIGSAYVNIRAITDKLESDVKSAISKLTDTITLTVDADVSAAHAKITALTNELTDHTITVNADTAEAQARIDALANEALGDQNVTVDANTLPARREFEDMIDDMDGRQVDVPVDVDDEAARIRLALLTKMRTLRINVLADSGPINRLGSAIGRLSGLRVAIDRSKALAHEFANIDKMVGSISKISTIFGALGGAIMSSVGGLSTLIASLGSIISMAAIAAPGMATGFIVGIGTLMVALKDFKNQLPDVVAEYKTLTTTIRGNFWANAREPIRDMATKLFPQMRDGLASVSGSLGEWAGSFANALKAGLSGGVLRTMFERLAVSIDIAKKANEPFTNSMITLGKVGSDLLPRLAKWWVDVATKFDNFISKAAKSGELQRWVEDGISALKDLGKLIGEVSGFFGGITEAARAAGSDGLSTLLEVFTKLNDAVNSPSGMKSLSTIFQGANTVADALASGLMDLFGAIGSAAPAIKSAFESVAGTIGSISGALSQIIANPEFQAGFTAMFDGIEEGAERLFSVLGTTGPKLGALMSIIGALASNIGGILGAALEVTLPLITAFKQAIDPLIPILGDALIHIIETLGPTFSILGKAISDAAPAVAEFVKWAVELVKNVVDFLGPALPGITAAIIAFMAGFKIGAVIQTVVNGIKGMIAVMSLMRTGATLAAAAQTVFNVALLANPIGLVIGAIAALVAGFVIAYNNIGWFKDGVDAAIKFVGDVIGNLVSFWNTDVVPMWNAALEGAGAFFGAIGKWVGEAVNNIGAFAGAIGTGISDAFNGMIGFFTDTFNNISNIINTAVTVISLLWNTTWENISTVFTNVWNGLVAFFGPIVELIVTIITGPFVILMAFWTMVWEIISTVFVGVWNKLVEFLTPIVTSIVTTIQTVVGNIVTWWTATWQVISDVFAAVWNGIVAFISPIISAIGAVINNVVTGISAAWNAVWSGISSFFMGIWNGIVGFISGVISGIQARIQFAMAYIQAIWNIGWGIINSVVSGVWTKITSIVGGIVTTVQQKIGEVVSFFTGLPGKVTSSLGSFASDMISIGKNVVQGLIDGARSMIDNAVQAIKDVGGAMLGGIKSFLGIKSPSREFMKIGNWVSLGLAEGITGGTKPVVRRIQLLAQRITDAATEHFKRANMASVIRAGQRNIELYQGRELDKVAAQIRGQVNFIGRLAAQKEALSAKLKVAQKNLDNALAVKNKEAASVAKNLSGEFKLSNFVGRDASDIAAGASEIANRIKAFGAKITQLKGLGLSPKLIAEVAGLGSSDGTEVANSLIAGGKGQVANLNKAYASIDVAAKSAGSAVAYGMYGAGIDALAGLVNGFKRNIASVDAAAKAVATRLLAQVKKTLGIRSPSRVMRDEIGKQIGAGLAQGIRDSISVVSKATDELMLAATPSADQLSLSMSGISGPVITAGTVYGAGATTAGLPQGQLGLQNVPAGGVNVHVYPAAGMDSVAVGKAAVSELNWQLISM